MFPKVHTRGRVPESSLALPHVHSKGRIMAGSSALPQIRQKVLRPSVFPGVPKSPQAYQSLSRAHAGSFPGSPQDSQVPNCFQDSLEFLRVSQGSKNLKKA